VLWGVSVLR